MQITVLGLGNAVLSDDSVGLRVVDHLRTLLGDLDLPKDVEVQIHTNEAGGWEVLGDVEGCDALILVDAILDDDLDPGAHCWYPRKVFTSPRMTGIHNMDVFTAMDFAARHGAKMPGDIHVLGIGVEDTTTFSEACTPAVEAAIPGLAGIIAERVAALAASAL